jgi:hypothetical protein
MSDAALIAAYIRRHGVVRFPPMPAHGITSYERMTGVVPSRDFDDALMRRRRKSARGGRAKARNAHKRAAR